MIVEKGSINIEEMPHFSFDHFILLRGINAGRLINNFGLLEKLMQVLIKVFPYFMSTKFSNWSAKLSGDHFMKEW